MGKTSGGRGTNQYRTQGVSEASRQDSDVIDRLAGGDYEWQRCLVAVRERRHLAPRWRSLRS